MNYVNRMAVMRHFVEDDGEFTGKVFDPVQLLSMGNYMGVGDIQTAIFASSYCAHEFVSPVTVEVRRRIIAPSALHVVTSVQLLRRR